MSRLHEFPPQKLRCADLFCGIGGFHVAAVNCGMEVVFACDIDKECRRAYRENFGLEPARDIVAITSSSVPDHDILMAGFPCQPFSIIGRKQGFSDPRGTLIFEAFRIIEGKKPAAVILENVKQIVTHNKGHEFRRILSDLEDLGYCVSYKILNARDFSLPQKRERVIIVGTQNSFDAFPWPKNPISMMPVGRHSGIRTRSKTLRLRNHSTETPPESYDKHRSRYLARKQGGKHIQPSVVLRASCGSVLQLLARRRRTAVDSSGSSEASRLS